MCMYWKSSVLWIFCNLKIDDVNNVISIQVCVYYTIILKLCLQNENFRLCIFNWSSVLFFKDNLPVIPDLQRISHYTMNIELESFQRQLCLQFIISNNSRKMPTRVIECETLSSLHLLPGALTIRASSTTHLRVKDITYLNVKLLSLKKLISILIHYLNPNF